jgi:hypothetical protein
MEEVSMKSDKKCSTVGTTPTTIPQRVYHLVTGVDMQDALNCQQEVPGVPTAEVAGLLNSAIQHLKAEVIDVDQGKVDYTALRTHEFLPRFRRATQCLQNFRLDQLQTRQQKLAFWINLYNALVIDGVVHYDVQATVNEIRGFFAKAAYVIDGYRFSANDIEHGILRANAGHPAIPGPQFPDSDPRANVVMDKIDPRIHFTLVCASQSCPPINVYEVEAIDQQLDFAAQNFINGGEFEVDLENKRIVMSKIFQWYAPDFGGSAFNQVGLGDFTPLIEYGARFLIDSPEKEAILARPHDFKVEFKPYDWSLNLL